MEVNVAVSFLISKARIVKHTNDGQNPTLTIVSWWYHAWWYIESPSCARDLKGGCHWWSWITSWLTAPSTSKSQPIWAEKLCLCSLAYMPKAFKQTAPWAGFGILKKTAQWQVVSHDHVLPTSRKLDLLGCFPTGSNLRPRLCQCAWLRKLWPVIRWDL